MEKASNPKVSIIVPVYNVEEYLPKCLDSLINQTLKDIEIICINDGSTDKSLQILKEYAKNDLRFVIIDQKNAGVSAARNAGLEKVCSEYVMFVDPDDWIDKKTCEETYAYIQKTNADIVSFGNYIIYKDNNKVEAWQNKLLEEYENIDEIPLKVIKHFIHTCWKKIIRTKFLKKHNIKFPVGIKVFEDGISQLFCLYNNPKHRFLNRNFYYYYKREDSVTGAKPNAINNSITANKFILTSENFKNASKEHQIITLEKTISDLSYFHNIKGNEKYRLKFNRDISEYKKWLYKNIDNNLLKDVPNIKNLHSFTLLKYIAKKAWVQKIFSITNTTDKKYKIITCLGIKIKFNKEKNKNKTEEKIVRKNYRKVLKKLQKECKNRKINVAF